ncbi:MAG: VOC family protein [Anaerolineae bacterium]|nr:VOC family protein [Anaerolineales bacterium]MCQ3977976.1 VOC family protein [Anaerolineae bacterium]
MTEMTAYTPGTFCWIDLGTSDAAAAKKFYSELLGWQAVDMPVGPDMTYTMFQIDGKDVAGMYQQGADEQGIPPHWNSYVSVASVEEIASKAKSLGGTVLAEPLDVLESGRMTVVQDPTGAVVAAWQPQRHIGAQLVNQPGALCWNELATRNPQKSSEFYTQLFGWTAQTQPMGETNYTVFKNGDNMNAGMIEMTAEWGDIPPHWMVYLTVTDCDASAEKVTALGGKILVPPTDIPDMGRFAVVQDPQGAAFSFIKLDNPPA